MGDDSLKAKLEDCSAHICGSTDDCAQGISMGGIS